MIFRCVVANFLSRFHELVAKKQAHPYGGGVVLPDPFLGMGARMNSVESQ